MTREKRKTLQLLHDSFVTVNRVFSEQLRAHAFRKLADEYEANRILSCGIQKLLNIQRRVYPFNIQGFNFDS